MKNKSNLFLKLSILINVLMIFFGAYLGNLYILQVIALGFAILSSNLEKIKIKPDTIIWLIACLIFGFSVIYSMDKQSTMEVASLISMAIALKILYENKEEDWQKYFLKLTLIASGIHVGATVLQLIIPNFISLINGFILSGKSLQMNQDLYSVGGYAGITGQTSVNAFYITLFIGIIFLKLMFEKRYKKINIVLLIMAIIALFLTGKRGMLIFSIISNIIIYAYISYKDRKNVLKYFFMILVIGIIGYAIIMNIPQAKLIFEKIVLLEESENVLNGRDTLWKETLEVFIENPIIGIGLGTIQNVTGDYSHNIYIQILAENGFIGFSIYILATLSSLYITIKKAGIILKKGEVNQKVNILVALFIQSIFIMYGFTGNPLYGQYFMIPYTISIAITNSTVIKEEKENENRYYHLS